MGSSIFIYTGARRPEALVVRVRRKAWSTFDATMGTSCYFLVRSEIGEEATWPATITSATPDVVTMSHTFDDLGLETARPGRYRLYPYLVLAGGGAARGIPLRLFILE